MSDGTPTPLAINNNGQEIPEAPPPQQTLSSAQHQFVTSVISLQEEQEQKEPSSRDKTFIQIQDAPPSADEIHQQPNYIAPVGLGLQQEPVLIPPSERRVWAQRRIFRPYFMWLISLVQVSTMIASFVINSQVTGTVLQMEPFNPMIGPSIGVLIHMGARYDPCMRPTVLSVPGLRIQCPQGTTKNASQLICSLEEICGLGAFRSGAPDQGERFFLAILLHGGILHLLFNIGFQLTTGAQLEKEIGWMRLSPIYFISGVGGFVFGGNFAGYRIPTLGSSGALFGIIACLFLDLLHNWSLVDNPRWELAKSLISVIFAFSLGMLPGIDNFSHIGGFLFGLFAGLLFMPTFYFSREDRVRKTVLRVLSVPILILLFAFLLKGYYDYTNYCPWCQYLNCIPGLPWCVTILLCVSDQNTHKKIRCDQKLQ